MLFRKKKDKRVLRLTAEEARLLRTALDVYKRQFIPLLGVWSITWGTFRQWSSKRCTLTRSLQLSALSIKRRVPILP